MKDMIVICSILLLSVGYFVGIIVFNFSPKEKQKVFREIFNRGIFKRVNKFFVVLEDLLQPVIGLALLIFIAIMILWFCKYVWYKLPI